jgi:signal transduction histidine kinase
MRWIRFSFVLLAVLLLVPLVILLDRTLSGLDRERDQRHQAVASRVFDEAERTLLGFLDEEEQREPTQYFPTLADNRPSVLAQPPTQPFVIDYFQIDSAGRVLSPRPNRDTLLALRLEQLLEDRPMREAKTSGRTEDSKHDLEEKMKGLSARIDRRDFQTPGSTKTVQKLDLLERRRAVKAEEDESLALEETSDQAYSSYGVLEKLNRAGRSRAKKNSEVASRQLAASPSTAAPTFRPSRKSRAEGNAMARSGNEISARFADSIADTDTVTEPADSERVRPDELAKGLEPSWAPETLRGQLAQSPLPRMASFAIDDGHLILYRSVSIPGKGGFQQGLLLDLDRFADWIEERVVVESGLARYITFDLVRIEELGALSARAQRRFVYDHRFDEPFDDLGARLSLASLPDTGGSSNIYIMGLLLLAVSTVGLWAMYRRVAVAVHFAERRSNFAAAVSHELKTPLTAIRMYAEMLRDGMVSSDEKRQEYYGTITSEAERLTRLINNVLEFSNLEKRIRKREITLGPIEASLREVIQILEPHAHSKGFTITLDIESNLPPVRFEADALQQILFNLIDNALKYAEDADRKQIEILARTCEEGVRICVRDHGSGVSQEHRPHLFEPFYRGENELTRRTKGTGIGLALVKGLADEMNAEIHASNATGGGFMVELRLHK